MATTKKATSVTKPGQTRTKPSRSALVVLVRPAAAGHAWWPKDAGGCYLWSTVT